MKPVDAAPLRPPEAVGGIDRIEIDGVVAALRRIETAEGEAVEAVVALPFEEPPVLPDGLAATWRWLLPAVAAKLPEGARLALVHRARGDGAVGSSVEGIARGPTPAVLEPGLRSLIGELDVLRRLAGAAFGTSAVDPGTDESAFATLPLLPAGITLPGPGLLGRPRLPRPLPAQPSPSTASAPMQAVIIARPRTDEPNIGLADALGAAARIMERFELRLELEPWRPDAAALRLMALTLDRAAGDHAALSYDVGTTRLDRIAFGQVVAELTRLHRAAAGCRLVCRLRAERPLPASLAALLGQAIFGTDEVDTQAGPADSLDLRGVLPSGRQLPAGMADIAALAAMPRGAATGTGASACRLGTASDGHPVALSREDRRRHAFLVGATGTGKSTLLARLAVADMQAGEGVIVIDPHGDLYADLLARVPDRRLADVVALDFADATHAPGLNMLDLGGVDPVQGRGFVANELMAIFDKLYDMRVAGGPMFESYLRNAVLLLLEAGEDATLVDLPRLFHDDAFRKHLRQRCRDPLLRDFWSKVAEPVTGEHSVRNMAPYVLSKLNQLTHNPLLRPIIGQARTTIDVRTLMDEGRIVLVNLAKGRIGDVDCRLLGMLLLGRVWLAAGARAALGEGERPPVGIYVDEFQSFATDTLDTMLAEARKFGLTLTLASQTLSQAAPATMRAVLGNVGHLIAFRLGVLDAQSLAPWFAPEHGALDLMRLPDHRALARLLVRGRALPPVTLRGDPPLPALRGADVVDDVLDRSRRRFMRPRDEVDAEIRAAAGAPAGA